MAIGEEIKPGQTQGLSSEAREAIRRIIGSRILIGYFELNKCFQIARGKGVGLHKIRQWETEGMPHQHHPDDRFYFYSWDEVWAWYETRGRSRRKGNGKQQITTQTWLNKDK